MKKILVVDDEPELVKAIGIRLKAANYEIITAYDGEEALVKARNEKPDLIVLDIMLPKMDGYKVCRMLKFDERYKRIPIIMLTVKAQESDKVAGLKTGADAYMTKPFEHKELIAKIDELLKLK